jgi:hypothetical protein
VQRDAQPPPESEGPPEEYRRVFACHEGAPLREASDLLTAAGIQFRVSGSATGFAVYVPEGEVSAAAAALRGRQGVLVLPDDAEPTIGAQGGTCPACGTSVPAGAAECPECGLVVGGEPEGEE